MTTNRKALTDNEVQKRADLALSSLSSGGLLAPEVFSKFIQIAQNTTPVLKAARRILMKSHTTKIPKILFAGRIMHASPGDNTALPDGQRSAPTTSEVSLNTKEINGEVCVPYSVFEDNVEGDALETTLMTLMAEAYGRDLEDLFLNGDTASLDTYLAQMNGWLKLITSNVVNAASADISETILDQAHTSVPLKYRQRGGFRWYMEDHAAEKWRSRVGARASIVGDKYMLANELPPYAGAPTEAVGHFPVTSGTPDTSVVLYVNPQNLIFGVWRDVQLETWRDIKKRQIVITINSRVACAVEQEDAASKITNVKAEL